MRYLNLETTISLAAIYVAGAASASATESPRPLADRNSTHALVERPSTSSTTPPPPTLAQYIGGSLKIGRAEQGKRPPKPVATPVQAKEKRVPKGYLMELGGEGASLSNNFGTWSGAYAHMEAKGENDLRSILDVYGSRRFQENGLFAGLTFVQPYDTEWIGAFSIGGGLNASWLPKVTTTAAATYKQGENRPIYYTIGMGYSQARRTYSEYNAFANVNFTLTKSLRAILGVGAAVSNPGRVTNWSGNVGLQYEKPNQIALGIRYGGGREAYQLTGPTTALSDFTSQVVTATIKLWLAPDFGVNALGEYYKNPNYDRYYFRFGLWKSW